MILDKISEDVQQQFKFAPYSELTQERVVEYIKHKYPGNYSVDVAEDMVIGLTFDTNEDVTLFILKYS